MESAALPSTFPAAPSTGDDAETKAGSADEGAHKYQKGRVRRIKRRRRRSIMRAIEEDAVESEKSEDVEADDDASDVAEQEEKEKEKEDEVEAVESVDWWSGPFPSEEQQRQWFSRKARKARAAEKAANKAAASIEQQWQHKLYAARLRRPFNAEVERAKRRRRAPLPWAAEYSASVEADAADHEAELLRQVRESKAILKASEIWMAAREAGQKNHPELMRQVTEMSAIRTASAAAYKVLRAGCGSARVLCSRCSSSRRLGHWGQWQR